MKILEDIVQGSDEWLEIRAMHPTASEAPVMMGASPKMRRNELLDMKATGIAKEVSRYVQEKLFDKGHEQEAMARPIIEKIIGEGLFPVVATDDDDWLLASFDGITMLEDTVFEHKMYNEALAEAVRAKDLPAEYYWQLEQQILVSGAKRAIFVTSDGTEDKLAWMEYFPVEGRAQQLVRGWKQFNRDLETYVFEAPVEKLEGASIEALPALTIKLSGMVEASNIDFFKQYALDAIKGINRELVTDQHFADAEKAVKWCGDVESKVKAAKQAALDETADIAALLKALDEIDENARQARLELDKLVKNQKAQRIKAITDAAQDSFNAHIAEINAGLGGRITLPAVAIDIASAIKGKRSLESIKNAADTEVARAKVVATEKGEHIGKNLTTLREKAGDKHVRLFADDQALVSLDHDALVAVIDARISEAEAAEAKRISDAEAAAAQKVLDDQAAERRLAEEAEAAKVNQPEPAGKAPAKSAPAAAAPLTGDFFGSSPEPVKPAEKTITITQAEYERLKQDSLLLDALRAAGVDNWDGYDEAQAMLAADAEA